LPSRRYVCPICSHNELLNALQLWPDLFNRRRQPILDNQYLRLGMVENVCKIAGDEAEVDRHVDGADQRRAEEPVHHPMVVLRDDRDAVSFFDPQASHQIRPAIHSSAELVVGQPQISRDYRLAIAVNCQSAFEEIVFNERNYHDKASRIDWISTATGSERGSVSTVSGSERGYQFRKPRSLPLAVLIGLDGAQLSTKSR